MGSDELSPDVFLWFVWIISVLPKCFCQLFTVEVYSIRCVESKAFCYMALLSPSLLLCIFLALRQGGMLIHIT